MTRDKSSLHVVNLREWRLHKALSQADLSRLSGIERATISKIEVGKHQPRPSTLRKLATALGVRPSDLYTDPFEPRPAS